MQTEPDVLTDHNELILSTNIERVVTGRDSALKQIEQLIQQLDAISRLTSEIGGGTAQDWAMKAGHRYDSWLTETVDKAIPAVTCNIDRSIWRDLMKKSGMLSLMDAQARDQWNKNLEGDDISAISEANILSTFEQLQRGKNDIFERGVINVFKGLSWNYKSNSPCQFGKKIILNGLVKHDRWGFGLNRGWQRDRLADLERMLMLLDGKPIPDNRADVTRRLDDHISQHKPADCYEDDLFRIKYFQKGSGHITFKRPELTDKMNDIVAKHFPSMLPSHS
ncbi:TPA: DUF4942 domain-containing protein [Yersinia enterocolitica]|nr:DUF4942 domain-containing protein [Yersinia enterocolitica]HEK7317273.1 DUF4942 domain-containing protein [Yersinia enterocolitica]HEN3294880.1 DUF4942 domain-containing protein [Yersinia enterocolitica]